MGKQNAPVIKEMLVGPEEALEWLANNKNNRTVSQRHVQALARLMTQGNFKFVGDPIRFDVDGNLLDGQHRLEAILASETEHRMVVITNLDPESNLYMDAGKVRSTGDQMKIALGAANGNQVAAISRVVMRWQAGDLLAQEITFTTPEVVEWAEPRLDILALAERNARAVRAVMPTSKAVCGAVFVQAHHLSPTDAETFFGRLADGADLDFANPIRALRETLLRRGRYDRLTPGDEVYRYVRAWNAWRNNEELTRIQTNRGGRLTMKHLVMR